MPQTKAAARLSFCLALTLAAGLVLTAGCDALSWAEDEKKGSPLPFEITSTQPPPDSLLRPDFNGFSRLVETENTSFEVRRVLYSLGNPDQVLEGTARQLGDTIQVSVRAEKRNDHTTPAARAPILYNAEVSGLDSGRYVVRFRHVDDVCSHVRRRVRPCSVEASSGDVIVIDTTVTVK